MLDQLNNLNCQFYPAYTFLIYIYSVFSCSKSLLSSFAERVLELLISATAGPASGSASLYALLVITQFSDQVKSQRHLAVN